MFQYFYSLISRLKPIYPKFNYIEMERDTIPIYNDIMNSNAKTYFINYIKDLESFDHYIWMDAAIACHSPIPYEEFKAGIKSKFHDKITVMQMRSVLNGKEYFSYHVIRILHHSFGNKR
jgi:hypothetical protein